MKPQLALFFLLLPLALAAQDGPSANREQGQVGGGPLWRQALGGAVVGLPTVQAQSVVVALDGGNIKAYSSSGRPLWNFSAKGRMTPFVSRSREGTSYISRTNGILIAINRMGRELWRRTPGGPLSGPVVTGWDGRLFVPTGKRISCYTAAGSLLWLRDFEERVSLSPQLDQGGGVMLSLESGEVFRIDPFGAALAWKLAAVPQALLSVKTTGGGSGDAPLKIVAVHKDGSLELLDLAAPGDEPQKLPKLPAPPLAAVSWGSNTAIALDNGKVVLVSPEGKILWTADSHIYVQGGGKNTPLGSVAMIYDERGVYTLTPTGATGFTGDGRRLWFTTLKNASGIPAFGDDGILYSGGQDWILYAWKIEDRKAGNSVYGKEPEGSYGIGCPPPSSWAAFPFRNDETEIAKQLNLIARGIQGGKVGENELEWAAYLMELVAGEYNRPGQSAARVPVQSIRRVQALGLLSRIGSPEAIPWLVKVFRRETDPALKAAAAGAIGSIGVDPNGTAVQAFLDMVSQANPARDEQALAAVASATGALCRFSGAPLSETGVRILTALSAASQPPSVQRQAYREMETLRQK